MRISQIGAINGVGCFVFTCEVRHGFLGIELERLCSIQERRTKMKRRYWTIGVVLLVACLSAWAFAQPGRGEWGRGRGPMGHGRMHRGGRGTGQGPGFWIILRLKEKLELSDEQVEKLEAIKDEIQEQFKAGAEAVKAKRNALREAVESGASEAAIRAAAVEVGGALGEQVVLRVSTKGKVDAVLTDTQKTKLKELREQRAELRKQWRGEGERRTGEGRRGRRGLARARDCESVFTRIDADADGAINLEEFKTHMEQMKERRGGRGTRGWHRPRPWGAVEE
jgi:Spy/CpxP family protein refolding chaperone